MKKKDRRAVYQTKCKVERKRSEDAMQRDDQS